MHVIVTGGRTYDNESFVKQVLDLLPIDHLIVGDAEGADKLARIWAQGKKQSYASYTAHWESEGRAAGPRRNTRMIKAGLEQSGGDLMVVAFPGGRGTTDCVKQASRMGIFVMRVENA